MNSDYNLLSDAFEAFTLTPSEHTQSQLKSLPSQCQTESGRLVAQSLLTLASSPDRRPAEARTLLSLSQNEGVARDIRCLAAWLAADVFRELGDWERCRLACDLAIGLDESREFRVNAGDAPETTETTSASPWITTSHRARLLRAHALRKLGDASGADRDLRALLDAPDLPPSTQVAAAIDLANSLWQSGAKDQGISLLKSILQFRSASRWADAMHNLTRMTASVGDYRYASEILRSLITEEQAATQDLLDSAIAVLDSARTAGEHGVVRMLAMELPASITHDSLVRFVLFLSQFESGEKDPGIAQVAVELVRHHPAEREYVVAAIETVQSRAAGERGDILRSALTQLSSTA